MKKRLLSLILAMLLLLALSACGGKAEPASPDPAAPAEEPAPAQTDSAPEAEPEPPAAESGTKTYNFYKEYAGDGTYTSEMKTTYDGVDYITLSAYDNGKIYSESTTGGVKSMVIMKDNCQYILDPSSKTCIKMSAEMMQDTEELFSDTVDSYLEAVSTGNTDIDGKSYYYEEFTVEGISVKYCFDGDDLKHIISTADGESYSVEILRFEKDVDPSLFEVPSDYTIMEY